MGVIEKAYHVIVVADSAALMAYGLLTYGLMAAGNLWFSIVSGIAGILFGWSLARVFSVWLRVRLCVTGDSSIRPRVHSNVD